MRIFDRLKGILKKDKGLSKEEIDKLFYQVPEGVDYTDMPEELDLEDVPEDTITKLRELMTSDDEFLRHRASRLLTDWGLKDGFDLLTQMFAEGKLEGYYPHRLYSYDDTNRIVLGDLKSYWASKADIGQGEEAREEIFPYLVQIIQEAESGDYDISGLYYLVSRNGFLEYTPYLKQFLSAIMDKPENNYWRIHDTLTLFLTVEPAYVETLLAEKGKTLADYGIEEKDDRN